MTLSEFYLEKGMAKRIATIDLKNILEIYLLTRKNYPKYGERFLYFIAACLYLNPEINLEQTLKLSPHGGLTEIDILSLDNYFKILQNNSNSCDAPRRIGFYSKVQSKRPWIVLCITLPNYEQVIGSCHGFDFFRFFCEDVQKQIVHFVGIVKQEIVVLVSKGFRYKTDYLIKELSLCSNTYKAQFVSFEQLIFRSLQQLTFR